MEMDKYIRYLYLLFLLSLACLARGQELRFSARTYLWAHTQQVYGDLQHMLPLYEFVDFSAIDVGIKGLNVFASGWGMLNILDKGIEHRGWGDLENMFVEYEHPKGRFSLQAGRLGLFDPGTFGDVVDGGRIHGELPLGFTVTGFGGFFTEEGFDDTKDTWLAGGRFGHHYVWSWGMTDLGVSYVRRTSEGNVDRDLLGVDISYMAPRYVDITGTFFYDLVSERPIEFSGILDVRPSWKIDLLLEYHYLIPSMFLPKTSIFTVFADDAQHRGGIGLDWKIGRFSPQFGFQWIAFKGMDDGYWGWVAIRGNLEEFGLIGFRLTRYKDYENGYIGGRWWVKYTPAFVANKALVITGDIQFQWFDQKLYTARYSVFSDIGVGYKWPYGLEISVLGLIRSDPVADYEAAGLLRLGYAFEGGKK